MWDDSYVARPHRQGTYEECSGWGSSAPRWCWCGWCNSSLSFFIVKPLLAFSSTLIILYVFPCQTIVDLMFLGPHCQEQLNIAKYAMDCASLSADFKEAVSFNLRKNKVDSSQHVAKAGVEKVEKYCLKEQAPKQHCLKQQTSHRFFTWRIRSIWALEFVTSLWNGGFSWVVTVQLRALQVFNAVSFKMLLKKDGLTQS